MKHIKIPLPTKRYSPEVKEKLYTFHKRKPAYLLSSLALGFILMFGLHLYLGEMQAQDELKQWQERIERDRQIKIRVITDIICETNPGFDPIYAKVSAEYIYENSGRYDPVFIAIIGKYEGTWKRDARSHAGAEGIWQIKPQGDEKKLSRAQRLFLEYQLEKCIERLNFFYGKHGTVYGMHRGYVGNTSKKNKYIADNYIAKIYTEFAERRGLIW